ncbi:hypothetical protein [Paenarthrobacter aurescens]|nr:hypothetical protein [Paenarthrobacter aurescens]MDO6142234.1 hypothetical protein [Paenarthrobacter aurescens]MDO6146082.1 hypothetical protein [Paenarthrobacter aurescens]MDO6157326.1 hypothetical protein [Paenarthrobacter aurescens]MDO6161311.1 hypothetical protein [Paenarthrobacter aurescens]
MTYRDSEREAIVDELLLDAAASTDDAGSTDSADETDVRQILLAIGSFADFAAPAPGAELSAMLDGPHDELSKRRWRHKHRTAVVSVAVVAAMGLGVSGVAAASSGFTRNPSFLDELLGNVRPQPAAAESVLPVPDAPRVTTEPAPVDPAAIPPAVPGETQAQATAEAQAALPSQAKAPNLVPAPANASDQSAPGPADIAPGPADSTPGPGHSNPGPAQSNPSAGKTTQSDALPGSLPPGNANQPNTAPNLTLSPQEKPGSGKEEKQQAIRPDASLHGDGKPAKTKPGSDGAKPGHLPRVPSNERADDKGQGSEDQLKQWLKRGDR